MSDVPIMLAILLAGCVGLALLAAFLVRRHYRSHHKERDRLHNIFNSIYDAIFIHNLDGSVAFINKAGIEMFGLVPEKATQYNVADFSASDCPIDQIPIIIGEAVSEGEKGPFEWKVKRPIDGKMVDIEVVLRLVSLEDQNAILATVRDVTERKRAEEELREVNRELDAFVYTVSHDLRSPLTPIIGYADLLRENCQDRLDENELGYLAEISASGAKMIALMEDLLSLAKVGQVERPSEAVDLGVVVTEVVAALTEQLSRSGLTVDIGPLPLLRLPQTLLAQIFYNLIGNAICYAGRDGGPIEVGGERRGDLVRFYVRDHGVGVPKEEYGRIFKVFYRGATGKKTPGTGVGLATVQKIARLYEGQAWVEETEGGGSTFRVELVDVLTAAETE